MNLKNNIEKKKNSAKKEHAENKKNIIIENNDDNIEIILGNEGDIEISEVGDCMNSLRPKKSSKKNIVIPKNMTPKNSK